MIHGISVRQWDSIRNAQTTMPGDCTNYSLPESVNTMKEHSSNARLSMGVSTACMWHLCCLSSACPFMMEPKSQPKSLSPGTLLRYVLIFRTCIPHLLAIKKNATLTGTCSHPSERYTILPYGGTMGPSGLRQTGARERARHAPEV